MSAPTYNTLEQLIEAAELQLNDVDVVSFDVFDTVFIRRIENPDLIKIPVARFVAEKANGLGIDISWAEVTDLRDQFERQQRKQNSKHYPDHEACYDDFMPQMLNRVFEDRLPQNFFDQVADYEIKLENAVLVPRARLVEWIQSLHDRGKRLFLISDIYLPAKYLSRMVADKNLDQYFEAVVSSADSFNAKASGSAYPLVEQRFNLDRDRWLHVGDNPISDGTRPLDFGIRAMVIADPAERHRKSVAKQYNYYSTHTTFWKGRNLQQLMLPLEAENTEHDELYVQGFNQFGYLFGYFMQRLAERCKQLNIKRIYFCSREGWMLQKCWDLFAPWYFTGGDVPESRYLYVSRIALARAMIGNSGLSQQITDVALLPRGNTNFNDVCRIFGLQADPFIPFLGEKGLTVDDVVSPKDKGASPANRRKLGLLLMNSKFQAAVKRSASIYRDAFIRYLDSEGFFDLKDVALVDIGWLGTIHNNLFNAVSHIDNAPNIHGFLMCATRYVGYPNTPGKYFEGLVYDKHKFDTAGSLLEYIKDIIEEICRAPHTSLVAYHPDQSEKGFRLEFRPDDDESAKAEQMQSNYYLPLQQGILDGVRAYAKAQAVVGYSTTEVKPWLNYMLYRHIAFPDTNDVLRMQIKAHQDDFAKVDTAKFKVSKLDRGLWQRTATALKFIPGIRAREFKKHCIKKLKT